MSAGVHFVQGGDAPILIGSGDNTLSCTCGRILIEGFRPSQFLGVRIQCGHCGAVTATPEAAHGTVPPASLIVAEPSPEPRYSSMTVPGHVAVIGRAEMDRLGTLLRPNTQADWSYQLSADVLDQAAAAYERYAGGVLPEVPATSADPFAGLREHALGWSVRHLRVRMRDESFGCMESAPTANAITHVTGFLHLIASWSRHPLFPAMMAAASARGCSLHGLAPFAAAHALALMGNRVGFRQPNDEPHSINRFDLAVGTAETVSVHTDVFDRFEYPFGPVWDDASLRSAVAEAMAASQGRINLRNPGVLLLSPGAALPGSDEALIGAIKAAMPAIGRRNRGLMAVAPIVLRLQALPDRRAVRFGYGLFPVRNPHYDGKGAAQIAS